MWFYYFASFVVRHYLRIFHGFHILGLENIPKEETGGLGLVVACNHMSTLDPPAIGSIFPREISFMAKKELFERQPMRWIAIMLNSFPVDRSKNDMGAIKEALRRIKNGVAVGIFIEGTRNQGSAEAMNGAAFLAQRAAVPLLPTAIWREGRAYYIRFGIPVMPEGKSREEMQTLTEGLKHDIYSMIPELSQVVLEA